MRNLKILALVSFTLIFVPSLVFAKKARTLYLAESKMETILITPGRSTVLSFPSHPTKVILGNQGLFAVEYVENDLAIAATRIPASGNLF